MHNVRNLKKSSKIIPEVGLNQDQVVKVIMENIDARGSMMR